jgi:cell wall assembly regulator SMI1
MENRAEGGQRSRTVIALSVAIVAGITIGFGLFRSKGNPMLHIPAPGEMYPHASRMPPVVPETVGELLARFERILQDRCPAALASLQPGLSDAEIDALEAKHQFKLPPDLRALYRWRNGARAQNAQQVFADHWFVPLDESLAERDQLRQQVKAGTAAQQQVHAAYAGHRDPWLGVIVDLAGDGYFFDPSRSEDQGSFFFCFNETGEYIFFPAFRNYLAGTIEGHKSGVFKFTDQGSETDDFAAASEIWGRYGAGNNE